MYQNISTSSIEQYDIEHESCLSILQPVPKSAMQQKCETLLRQCSQSRTTIRELKQDIEWLQVTNTGLTNQSTALKEILTEKKETIVEINSQLKNANQEINRLEDQGYRMEGLMEQLKSQVLTLKNELKNKNEQLRSTEAHFREQSRAMEALILQKQEIKSRFDSKQTLILTQIQQRMTKLLQPSSKPIQKSPTPTKINRNSENIMLQLIDQMQRMLEKQNHDQKSHHIKINQKQQIIQKQGQRIFVLECQLREATELMEQYQQNSADKDNKVKEIQSKMEIGLKSAKKNMEKNVQTYRNSIDKLTEVLAKTFLEEQAIITKVKQLMKFNHSEYELDISLNELRQVLSMQSNSQKSKQNYKKQATETEHRLNNLMEQYDTLKLKYLTLQRQHEAILQDNRRILKFNQLSRFRMDRNMKGAWRGDKQNISSNCSTQGDKVQLYSKPK